MGEKSKDDWLKGVPRELADILRGGTVKSPEPCLPANRMPLGFEYPATYKKYVEDHPSKMLGLGSWGYCCDLEARSAAHSQALHRSLVLFGQAYGDDMVAFFEVSEGGPRVLVMDLWSQPEPIVVVELEGFEAWLSWARQDAIERGLESRSSH